MKRILLIDDSPELRENVAEILILKGFTVEQASNAYDAISKIEDKTPQLIICDVEMPGMNGFEFFSWLKNFSRFNNIPFIFLTAVSSLEERCLGLEAGADHYLVKPFNSEELLSIVNGKFRKNEFSRQNQIGEMTISVKDIENLIELVSHGVRSPLCSSLGLMNLLSYEEILDDKVIADIVTGLKVSTLKMDDCTSALTSRLHELLKQSKQMANTKI
jgi:CheY-like chemotaxis protein